MTTYSNEYLMAHRHLGPAMLGKDLEEGKEIHRQAQALVVTTAGGKLGPALLSTEPVGHNRKPEKPAGPPVETPTPASAPPAVTAPKGKGK